MKEESGIIPCDTFTDEVYFNVKEMYEDFEERGYQPSGENADDEGETFGWNLSDSWHEIGSVYIFLLSMYNLIDTPKDESPIIDSKGIKNGMQNYSVQLEILDYDKTTKLNILEYETLRELVGKNLKVKFCIKRATDIPDKYNFKTMAKYEWIDGDRTVFETSVKEKQRDPDFQYVGEHIEPITEDLVQYLMYNTLTIKVLGMIESKKKKKPKAEAYASDYQSDASQSKHGEANDAVMSVTSAAGESSTPGIKNSKTIRADPRLSELENKNAELMRQLEEAKKLGGKQAACCTIF